jgi:hypothetical protein
VLRSEAFGGAETVFLMESAGLYNQNQLIVSVNSLVNRNLSLNGSYAYNRSARSEPDARGEASAAQLRTRTGPDHVQRAGRPDLRLWAVAGRRGRGGGGRAGGRRWKPRRPNQPVRRRRSFSGIAAPANRCFNLTISMYIRNMTNHNNPGPIIGDITSPLFGQANQPAGVGGGIFSESANNRRLELQTRLTF